MTKRSLCITRKVPTQFGSAYLQVDLAEDGKPTGGRIATHGKEPESQIGQLIETLSDALDALLAEAGGAER